MSVQDKVVVITGAGAGIGRAGAIEFARAGARVVVADINGPGATETVRQIQDQGGMAIPVEVDVADPAAVQELVRQTLEAFSEVHVLFNNAAIQVNKMIEDTTPEEWSRQMAVNVGGIFLCSKFFLPHLRKTRGSILNMASVNGFFVEPMCAGYCATKGAIIALTKAMAIDHGRQGIRVNCLCPGDVDTPMLPADAKLRKIEWKNYLAEASNRPLGRIGTPDEIARAALFLATDDSSFMTGAVLAVDGGGTAD